MLSTVRLQEHQTGRGISYPRSVQPRCGAKDSAELSVVHRDQTRYLSATESLVCLNKIVCMNRTNSWWKNIIYLFNWTDEFWLCFIFTALNDFTQRRVIKKLLQASWNQNSQTDYKIMMVQTSYCVYMNMHVSMYHLLYSISSVTTFYKGENAWFSLFNMILSTLKKDIKTFDFNKARVWMAQNIFRKRAKKLISWILPGCWNGCWRPCSDQRWFGVNRDIDTSTGSSIIKQPACFRKFVTLKFTIANVITTMKRLPWDCKRVTLGEDGVFRSFATLHKKQCKNQYTS